MMELGEVNRVEQAEDLNRDMWCVKVFSLLMLFHPTMTSLNIASKFMKHFLFCLKEGDFVEDVWKKTKMLEKIFTMYLVVP